MSFRLFLNLALLLTGATGGGAAAVMLVLPAPGLERLLALGLLAICLGAMMSAVNDIARSEG